jgi:mono/diheme cytochrome c family protein
VIIYRSTFLLALTGLVASASAQAPEPRAPALLTPELLAAFPAGEGREATVRVCSGCHALEIITQQRLGAGDWAQMVDMMAGRGAQGTDADFNAITAYLAKAFPAA